MKKENKKYPEGYFISTYMSFGLLLGIPFGLAMRNIALGLPLGLAIGVAIGYAVEEDMKKKGRIRALTKKEKAQRKRGFWIGIIGVLLAIIAGIIFGLMVY